MSHFTVTVCLSKDQVGDLASDEIEACVAAVLAPYDENEEAFREGSRWDWWVIGGRWSGYFIARSGSTGIRVQAREEGATDGGRYDVIRASDIDWEAISAAQVTAAADYWLEGHARPMIFGLDPAMTREQYLASRRYVATHALVTTDGAWLESARMGWFGQTMEEGLATEVWERRYLDYVASLDGDDVLVLVDCHV